MWLWSIRRERNRVRSHKSYLLGLLSIFFQFFMIIGIMACITLGIVLVCRNQHKNQINKNTIEFVFGLEEREDGKYHLNYGDVPDYDKIYVTYERNDGEQKMVPFEDLKKNGCVTIEMYDDNDIVDTPKSITIEFKGKEKVLKFVIDSITLKTPIVSFESNTIRWENIDYATGYDIYVGKEPTNLNKVAENIEETYFDLTKLNIYGDLVVYVEAISDSEKVNTSNKSIGQEFVRLKKVFDYSYVEGKIEWDSCDGADYYKIYHDGIEEHTDYNFFEYTPQVGDNIIVIEACSSKQNVISDKSETFVLTKLKEVYDFNYYSNKITWNADNKASNYSVYIDDAYYSDLVEKWLLLEGISCGIHKIDIVSKGNDATKIIPSNKKTIYSLIELELEKDSDIVSWDGINLDNCIFDIIVDNEKICSTGNNKEVDLSSLTITSGAHSINVKVISAYDLLCDISKALTFVKLKSPELTVNKDHIEYDNVLNTIVLKFDDEEFDGSITGIESGYHSVSGKYLASNDNEIDSSETTIVIYKLSCPIINIENEQLIFDDEEMTIEYYIDGVEFDKDFSSVSAGNHSITARYIGNNTTIITSELSNALTITKLGNPVISIENEELKCDDSTKTIKYYIDGTEFDGDFSSVSAGNHSITARYIGNNTTIITSELSNVLSIAKLSNPVISISNNQLMCDDSTKNIIYFIDGVEFDKDFSKVSAGNHNITARYIGNDTTIITSELSNVLSITKLSNPVISISNNQLMCDDSTKNIIYFIDGVEFDKDFSSVSSGNHNITARYIGNNTTIITSELSNKITITKLSNPIIKIENGKLMCDDTTKVIKFYIDGIEFDCDFLSVSAGDHVITANYIGDGSSTITSESSNELTIDYSSVYMDVIKTTSNRVNIYLDAQYDLKVYFFEDGTLIDTFTANNCEGQKTVTYLRSGQLATSIIAYATVKTGTDDQIGIRIREYIVE